MRWAGLYGAALCLHFLACRGETRRFIAVGDTGRGDEAQALVGKAMADKCKKDGCDFVLLLGDNFYLSGVDGVADEQWQSKFEQPYAAVTAPFYVVLGNHDYGGGGGGFETERANYQVQYSLKSKRWRMPARFYQHREGPVDLIGLDTTAMLFQDESEQSAVTSAYLTNSTARWKIAMGHHPYFSNGPHGDAGSYDGSPGSSARAGGAVKAILDSAVCGKADLYLAGHDHNLQVLQDDCLGTKLIVSGTGAATTELPGAHQESFQRSELGFVYFVATDHSLSFDVITTEAGVVYSSVIRKNAR